METVLRQSWIEVVSPFFLSVTLSSGNLKIVSPRKKTKGFPVKVLLGSIYPLSSVLRPPAYVSCTIIKTEALQMLLTQGHKDTRPQGYKDTMEQGHKETGNKDKRN